VTELSTSYLSGDKTAGISYKTGSEVRVPWPWSKGLAGDFKHRFYGNILSAPVLLTDWVIAGDPRTSYVTEDLFTQTVTDAVFCSGALNGIGAIKSQSGGDNYPIGVVPYSATTSNQTNCWGDHYLESLIMEHDIGSDGYIMDGVIVRHTGKAWLFEVNGNAGNWAGMNAGVGISTDSLTGDVTLNLYTTGNSNFPAVNATLFAPAAATKLNLVQVHISSGTPYVKRSTVDTTFLGVVADVTIRCWYAGQYAELSGVLPSVYGNNGPTSLTNVIPWTTLSPNFFAFAQIYYNLRANIASLAAGSLGALQAEEVALAGQAAWANNVP
jgi:hypothetical protein